MKKHPRVRRPDLILIAVIIAAAAGFFIFTRVAGRPAQVVTVKVAGQVTGTYSLDKDREVSLNHGTNTLQIKAGQARIIAADCPDQICVRHRAISRDNESIICLPNQLVVEVSSHRPSEYDAVQ